MSVLKAHLGVNITVSTKLVVIGAPVGLVTPLMQIVTLVMVSIQVLILCAKIDGLYVHVTGPITAIASIFLWALLVIVNMAMSNL